MMRIAVCCFNNSWAALDTKDVYTELLGCLSLKQNMSDAALSQNALLHIVPSKE